MTLLLSPLFADAEAKSSFRRMRIHRKYSPVDFIEPRRQRAQWYAQLVAIAAIDLRPAAIDAGAAGIAHLDPAESRLQVLGKPQADFAGSGAHGTADQRAGMIEHGMRVGRSGGHKQQWQDCDHVDYALHGQLPDTGLLVVAPASSGWPMLLGKMSSR